MADTTGAFAGLQTSFSPFILLTSTSKPGLGPGAAAIGGVAPSSALHAPPPPLASPLISRLLPHNPEFSRYFNGQASRSGLADFLFLSPQTPHDPKEIFPKLRWGALVVFVSTNQNQTVTLSQHYADHDSNPDHTPPY